MRWIAVPLLLLATLPSIAAQPAKPAQDARLLEPGTTVYREGKDVTAPALLSTSLHVEPINPCKHKQTGTVVLDFVVDADGSPRNAMLDKPLGSEFDGLALKILHTDRFNSGARAGIPVAVAQTATIEMTVCEVQWPTAEGQTTAVLKLGVEPGQSFHELDPKAITSPPSKVQKNKGVSAPYVLFAPEANFTEEALRLNLNGTCVASLVVDAEGMPTNVKLRQCLGHGLDESAMESVQRYRFRPAMRDGQPIAVAINIEINFRLSATSGSHLLDIPPPPKFSWQDEHR